LTNSEVCKLLSNFSLIRCDLLALRLSKVAEGIRPHPEALAHMNDTSPQDQFITEGVSEWMKGILEQEGYWEYVLNIHPASY
jgi:hypothetical protein